MKTTLLRWVAKFDALSARERGLLAAALLVGVAFVLWTALIDPDRVRMRVAEQNSAAQRVQLQMLQAKFAVLQSPERSPEVIARGELDSLKKKLGEAGEKLATLESVLVPPKRMNSLLESMIGGRSGLRLLSLRTLPVQSVLEKKEKDGSAKSEVGKPSPGAGNSAAALEAAGLFKHGVELRLEGSYADLADYLARLEQQPQKLLWSSVSLVADKQSRLVLTLTVFTLSLDRAWLAF